jgi:hypothetical protein
MRDAEHAARSLPSHFSARISQTLTCSRHLIAHSTDLIVILDDQSVDSLSTVGHDCCCADLLIAKSLSVCSRVVSKFAFVGR